MRERSSRIIIDNDTLCLFKNYVEDSEKEIYSMGKKKLTKHKTFRVLRAWAAPTSDGWHICNKDCYINIPPSPR